MSGGIHDKHFKYNIYQKIRQLVKYRLSDFLCLHGMVVTNIKD